MDQSSTATEAAPAVARVVAAVIADNGIKVNWLCDRTGIPRSTMNRRLAGHSAFNLNELDRIAAALRIPTTDLLSVGGAA